jgi:hypothetical protein
MANEKMLVNFERFQLVAVNAYVSKLTTLTKPYKFKLVTPSSSDLEPKKRRTLFFNVRSCPKRDWRCTDL